MSNKEAVRRLLGLLKEYKKKLIIIVGCLLFSVLLNLCIPLLSRRIMDEGFIAGNQSILIKLVLLSLVIYAFDSMIELYKEKKRVDIFSNIQFSLSDQAYSHLMKVKIQYFSTSNYTEIMNSLNMDISNMSAVADDSVFFVISQLFSMAGGVLGLLLIDYRMTLLVLAFIPLKYVIMKIFAKKRKEITDRLMKCSQEYAKWFGDTAAGVREIRIFGIFQKKHEEFTHKYNQIIEEQKNINILGLKNVIFDRMIVQLLIMILYIAGSNLVLNFELSIGSIFAFITYSTYVTSPISAILNIGYLLAGIIPSTKRYYEFMEIEEEEEKEMELPVEFERLEFQNVDFGYNENDFIFTKVNFTIEKGEKCVLVGGNGSGKSTILNIILRLYEPSSGKILLNKVNINSYPLSKYRELFSIVSQDIYLFDDTIRNNISLYKEVSDEVILKACKDSGLEEFCNTEALGFRVGVNGRMLSGGQKQKLALVRALVYERPVIIFDEATSNADLPSEIKITELLETRLKHKTVIVVTHKMELVEKFEKVLAIRNGAVLEKRK